MNSKNLNNFHETGNNIPYISGYQDIGDFLLEKNPEDKKIIENAKIGYSIYGVKSLEELKNTKKKIIVVIPALTGTNKIFDTNPGQGNGWANIYGKDGNILDPNENIIIGLDYFGSAFNNHKNKHNLDFYPVPPEKQVEAWKLGLERMGIKNIDVLFGGSNGGGHVHYWVTDGSHNFDPKYLISVSGPANLDKSAREFFKINLDFLNGKNVGEDIKDNIKNLKGQSSLFDFLIEYTIKEIEKHHNSKNEKIVMKIVRQIGFLKFVGPTFFDRFWNDKKGKQLSLINAQNNIKEYFENEGEKFEKRIGKSYFKTLLEGLVDSPTLTPKDYASKIGEKVNIILINTKDDTLFDSISIWSYFLGVKTIREESNHKGTTVIDTIKSSQETKAAAHDYFLWENGAQKISDEIMKIISFKK